MVLCEIASKGGEVSGLVFLTFLIIAAIAVIAVVRWIGSTLWVVLASDNRHRRAEARAVLHDIFEFILDLLRPNRGTRKGLDSRDGHED
ncbi:MAG: hypothetical protein ACJ73S_01420 [Mycobacteriales bacterium]